MERLAMNIILTTYPNSEHFYHHKNQWYSWTEKAAWFECWNPQIPTDCGVHFPLCLYDYRLIVNSQHTPTYITFGLAFTGYPFTQLQVTMFTKKIESFKLSCNSSASDNRLFLPFLDISWLEMHHPHQENQDFT